jgi:hypothetical protein
VALMEQVVPEAQEHSWTWSRAWRFGSPESLREDGLEQVCAFLDGSLISRYGEFLPGGDDGLGNSHLCAVRKRAEIDRCMELLKERRLHRLLDVYYRQGYSIEHRGWAKAARIVELPGMSLPRCPGPVRCQVPGDDRMTLPTCPAGRHCQWDHDQFEATLKQAVIALWRVHQERWKGEE